MYIAALVLLGGVSVAGCVMLATEPDNKPRFSRSPHYDAERGVFQNRGENVMGDMNSRTLSMATLKEFWTAANRVPSGLLPEVRPDLVAFLKPGDPIKVIWFGHSTFLLNIEGKTVLVDPVFSDSAGGPVPFVGKRFQKPVLELRELPSIDYVVISHDHYDHLDKDTIRFFRDKKARFVTPLGVGDYLVDWGISSERIVEVDWWQSYQVTGLEFVATPAQHESGRGLRKNRTLWASWVILGAKAKVFYSGDTGYDTHFKEIGAKYGPFDIAFMETGQYHPRFPEGHLLPEDGVKAFLDVNAKCYFPVHWGMFTLNFHPWNEPPQKMSEFAKAKGFTFVTPKIGQVVEVNDSYRYEAWWTGTIQSRRTNAAE